MRQTYHVKPIKGPVKVSGVEVETSDTGIRPYSMFLTKNRTRLGSLRGLKLLTYAAPEKRRRLTVTTANDHHAKAN